MWHKVFNLENNIIVYSMSAFGPQIVEVNGQVVFKKNQNKYPNTFLLTVVSDSDQGNQVRLVSKMDDDSGDILLDLFHGEIQLASNTPLASGKFHNKPKNEGISQLKKYALDEAFSSLRDGLALVPLDAEIYFHLACIYSLQENAPDAIASLDSAFAYGYTDIQAVKTHDHLAYLRIQDAYDMWLSQLDLDNEI